MAPDLLKVLIVLISFTLLTKNGLGQEACGTQINETTAEYLSSQLDDVNTFIRKKPTLKNVANYKFPIKIHIVRRTNGTGGITAAQANQSIVELNADFAGAGIEFFQCAAINYINNDAYYDYEQPEEQEITDMYNLKGAINLYYFNRVKTEFDGTFYDVCGYAYLPLGLDHLMLRNSCILNSNTLSHEMGHYFGLLHTHDTRYGAEAITRNTNDACYNCETNGDQLCDTDADPNLNTLVDINCNYTGTAPGPCGGGQYTPQTDNTMAYSTGACSTTFTAGQNSRMNYYAFQRSYTGCIASTCATPFNLNETNNTGTAITLSWTAPPGGGVSEIRYRISGAIWNYGGAVVSPLTLTDISQGFSYEYSIRTRCSDMEVSEWVDGSFVSIPTQSSCNPPNSWASSNEGKTSYGLTWGAMSGATGYRLRYRQAGTNDAWTTLTVNATNAFMTGLDEGTTYEFQLETICGNDNSGFTRSFHFTTLGNACVDVQIKVMLEGALADPDNGGQYLSKMRTELNTDLGLLPGQTPISSISAATPAGQPYAGAPWSYNGTEGANWTDHNYLNWETQSGSKIVDWILLTFRTGTNVSDNFKRVAALLMEDGAVIFPAGCPITAADPTSFYIMVEHRNHIGAMTPNSLTVNNKLATYDFTLKNSYGGNGQKQVKSGVWALFAGEGEQNIQGFDVNGDDKTLWSVENGKFSVYDSGDFNMNGDVNGSDKNYWSINNGVSSALSR